MFLFFTVFISVQIIIIIFIYVIKKKIEIMDLMKKLDKKFKININLKNSESYGAGE